MPEVRGFLDLAIVCIVLCVTISTRISNLTSQNRTMNRLSIYDAKARFSEVIEQAQGGASTEITKRGRVVARIVPAASPEWDRSAVLDEADKLLKSRNVSKRVNLADLIVDRRP